MHLKLTPLAGLAAALSLGLGATAQEAGWNCRNMDYEIGCSGGVCEASDAHTPMDIYVTSKELSACAYTGCWEGAPTTLSAGRFLTFLATDLPFSTRPEMTGNIALTIDTQTYTATILVADMYAMPATCSRWAPPSPAE